MEAYQFLRLIDQLKVSVDNLVMESCKLLPRTTSAISNGEQSWQRDISEAGLLREQIDRIDVVALVINEDQMQMRAIMKNTGGK